MEHKSYWQATIKLPRYPAIQKNSDYDIVIVGGGMSGITLAYRLKDCNFKVALLEADTLASKTTGQTTGKISYLHGINNLDIVETYGMALGKQYLDSNYEAFQEIKQLIDKHQIDCDYQENISYLISHDQANNDKLLKQIKLFKRWGFEVIARENAGQVIMGLKHQAIFNPLKYLLGLLKECKTIDIYEHSLVSACDNHGDGLSLTVNGVVVKCNQVVWMTRYPPNYQKAFFLKILQESHHVVYQNQASGVDSILDLTNSSSKRYLDKKHILAIKPINDESFYWAGQDSVPLRKVPYIGKIKDNEYGAYGYNKWGMTLSHVASKLIAELLIYNDSKYTLLYRTNYGKYMNSKKEVKQLVKNNYQGMIKNRLLASKEVELLPNQGKVIRYQGHLFAVYKDSDNRLFYFSPYCPHLKCVLSFSQADRRWSCPCHGSVFSCYGKVIHGPATNSLKKMK